MKRSLIVLVVFALLVTACASTTAPGTTGVITAVNGNQITVAAGDQTTTYTLVNRTNVYSPEGLLTQRSFLSQGQRVMVWADNGVAVRINVGA
jgi:ABC-type Fe3+-hydroxamate transport system substrate-binding protein